MAVNRDTLRIEKELQALITQVLDAQTRALVEAWVVAWDEVSGVVEDAMNDLVLAASAGRVTRTMVLRSERAQAALTAVADALEQLAKDTGIIVSGDLMGLVRAAADSEVAMIGSQLTGPRRANLAVSLVRADQSQIYEMVKRATEQITSLALPVSAQTTAVIKRELLRGIAVGDNPRSTARRMVRSMEDRFEGGLARALVISRTETLDAMRRAAKASDVANADIVTSWIWISELSTRTCPACVAMHGSVHDVEEDGPLGHQQCRCMRVPKTKSWRELGFDIDDPADTVQDPEAWFDGLKPDKQEGILGPKRFEAWQAGNYPMSGWVTRRTNPGWRDSFVVSAAPRS